MPKDPGSELLAARRRYADALMRRDSMVPGRVGYHEAVLEVGLAWNRMVYWTRRLEGSQRRIARMVPFPVGRGTVRGRRTAP